MHLNALLASLGIPSIDANSYWCSARTNLSQHPSNLCASTRQRKRQSHQHTLDTRVQGELARSAHVLGHKSHLCCATTGLQRTAFMRTHTICSREDPENCAAGAQPRALQAKVEGCVVL